MARPLALLLYLLLATKASGTTFTVTSTADSADMQPGDGRCAASVDGCTLRAALDESNAHRGVDAIRFRIKGTGQHTIATTPQVLTDQVTIDGLTQPGSAAGNILLGRPMRLQIHVIIDNADNEPLFYVKANHVVIRGLDLENVTPGVALDAGIRTANRGEGDHVRVEAVYAHGFRQGIFSQGADGMFGGCAPGRGVRLSGNRFVGVAMNGRRNTIAGSLIGLSADGTARQENGGVVGVLVEHENGAVIGGRSAACRNVIAGGVMVDPGTKDATVRFNNIGLNVVGKRLTDATLSDNGTNTRIANNRGAAVLRR